jgi:hypothetical protein
MKPDVTEENKTTPNDIAEKFEAFRVAILEGKRGASLYRNSFLDSCIEYADKLRIRQSPLAPGANFAERIVDDCGKLVSVRNAVVDWVILESEAVPSKQFIEALLQFLEKLRGLKLRPTEVSQWNEVWFEAHKLFVYETFLYVIAALIKTRSYEYLHEIFVARFLRPSEEYGRADPFARFDDFYAHSEILNSVLALPNQKLYSPAGELVSRQAKRKDLPLGDIVQADLLVLMMALIDPETRWYPQLLYYAGNIHQFPLFTRAAVHKDFLNLAVITGMQTGDGLRAAVQEGAKRLNVASWQFFMIHSSLGDVLNLSKLDTIK